jgi:hypothetical protein
MKRKPKHVNNTLELRQLQNSQWIDTEYKLLDKGIALLDAVAKNIPYGKVDVKTFDVDQYLILFPKGKLPSGKPARINKKVISEAFIWFFKNYDYEWDIVMKATALYVDEFETKNYLYMKNSQYFIRKQMSDKSWDSELANYCDLIINGTDDTSSHFSENVV